MNILKQKVSQFEELAYQILEKKKDSKITIDATAQEWEQIGVEITSIDGLLKTEQLALFLNLSNKTNSLTTAQRLSLMKGLLGKERKEELSIETLKSITQRNGVAVEENNDSKFWNEIITPSQRRIDIKPSAIRNLLTKLNFYKNPRGGFVQLKGKILSVVSVSVMIDSIEQYIEKVPIDLFNEFSKDEIKDALVDKSNLFNNKNLLHLHNFKRKLHRCTANKIFFYGKDAFVEITKNGMQIKSYERLDGVVWENQIMDIDFSSFDFDDAIKKSDFEEFMFDISGRNRNDLNYLKKLTGYLLHKYNDQAFAKAVILIDKGATANNRASGGRGKNVYSGALNYMRNVNDTIDGRNYEFNSNPFKEVNESDDIVLFNDVDQKFPFERLVNPITEGFTIRKLYQNPIKLSFIENPKVLINSNFAFLNDGSYSEERRALKFYFDDYYQKKSLIEKFDKRFFTEWDKKEWNRFRMFMFQCAYEYLRHPEVLIKEKDTDLIKKTSKKFVNYLDENLKYGVFYNRARYKETLNENEIRLSSNDFTSWMIAYFDDRKLKMKKGTDATNNPEYFYKKGGNDGFKILE